MGGRDVVREVTVRRASRRDLEIIAEIMRRASRDKIILDEGALLGRLFEWGYWVSATSKVMGVVGWQATNFIACFKDFYVYPPVQRRRMGSPLLQSIEEEARALSCEVALFLVDRCSTWRAIKFYRELGYERAKMGKIVKAWCEVAEEHVSPDEIVLLKKLRETRIMAPI
jgi:N-acetylglutamate synthase-like GNAT family acetyltransferase